MTGVAGTGTLNTVSINADQTRIVTGVSSTGTVWSVTAVANNIVTPSGVSGAGTLHSITVVGDGRVPVTGVAGTGFVNSVVATNHIDTYAIATGVRVLSFTGQSQTYITDGSSTTVYGGLALALVGDFVGTGTIQLIGDPINNQITYRGIPLALETATVTPHTGPHHPTDTVPATLAVGSPDCIVSNQYRLVRISDPATCSDPVTVNPALVDPTIRISELHERGNPPIA